jgi:hypothetical protein
MGTLELESEPAEEERLLWREGRIISQGSD